MFVCIVVLFRRVLCGSAGNKCVTDTNPASSQVSSEVESSLFRCCFLTSVHGLN